MSEHRFFRLVPRKRPRPTRPDFSSTVDAAGNEWPDAEWHEVQAWTPDIAGADDPGWLAADFREHRAAEQGETLTDVVRRALERYVKAKGKL